MIVSASGGGIFNGRERISCVLRSMVFTPNLSSLARYLNAMAGCVIFAWKKFLKACVLFAKSVMRMNPSRQ